MNTYLVSFENGDEIEVLAENPMSAKAAAESAHDMTVVAVVHIINGGPDLNEEDED